MASTHEHAHDCSHQCGCCSSLGRRDFMTTVGLASLAAPGMFGLTSAVMGGEPAANAKPRIRAVFLRPDTDRGDWMSWPGVTYDNKGGQAMFTKIMSEAADKLGVNLEVTDAPLVDVAAIDKLLAGDAKAYANTRLLSVSFDPKHDTPRVLREYGLQYVNGTGKDAFAHWSFAAPSKAELDKVLEWFDVGVTGDSDSGNMMHSLSTLVVDKQGRLVAWYPSNDWKMEDVASELRNEAVK